MSQYLTASLEQAELVLSYPQGVKTSIRLELPQVELICRAFFAADPHFDAKARAELDRRIADLEAGVNCSEHELLDDDDAENME
jgi:hypothetical protein